MITIRFSGRVPSPRTVSIGQETDSRADTLRFILPEIADGQEATLQMILPDGTPDAVLIQDGMITIPARMTEIAGRTRAWVEILAGDVLAWHSEILYLEVGELPPISERTEQEYPTAFQQVIAQSLANKNAAQAAQTAAEAAQEAAEDAAAGAAQEVRDALEDLAEDAAASATQAAGSATQAAGSAEQAAGSASSAAGSAAAAAGSAGSAAGYALAAAGSANDAESSAAAAAQSAREAEAAAHITIDQTPRAGSANPVASGGVYNALETKQDTLTFDNVPTEGSDNPVKSGGVKEALDGKKNTQTAVSSPSASGNALAFIDTISQDAQGVITATKKSVTIDATPTANSTNPVASGGVKTALDGKQNALTFDNIPTANSNNPVKSSGIKEGLDEKLNSVGKGVNLLDNWYFVGGGSQQGGRQLPINQRGKTSYTGASYTIDRWYVVAGAIASLTENGIQIRYNVNYADFRQVIDANLAQFLNEKTVTISILTGEGHAFYVVCNGLSNSVVDQNTLNVFTFTFKNNNPGTTGLIKFWGAANVSGIIKAVKLEIGDTQTLAHQENGEWVLNDPPPDYDTELLKCQMSTADSGDTYANRKLIPITANMGTVTGTGSTVTVTKTVTGVTSNMTVDRIEFGTPSAVKSGWTVTTATDSVTFSATISGSTMVKIKLSDNTDVTGT